MDFSADGKFIQVSKTSRNTLGLLLLPHFFVLFVFLSARAFFLCCRILCSFIVHSCNLYSVRCFWIISLFRGFSIIEGHWPRELKQIRVEFFSFKRLPIDCVCFGRCPQALMNAWCLLFLVETLWKTEKKSTKSRGPRGLGKWFKSLASRLTVWRLRNCI